MSVSYLTLLSVQEAHNSIPVWIMIVLLISYAIISSVICYIGYIAHETKRSRQYLIDVILAGTVAYIFFFGITFTYTINSLDWDAHNVTSSSEAVSLLINTSMAQSIKHSDGNSDHFEIMNNHRFIGLILCLGFMVSFCILHLYTYFMEKNVSHILPNSEKDKLYTNSRNKEIILLSYMQYYSFCLLLGILGGTYNTSSFFYHYIITSFIPILGISFLLGSSLIVLDITPLKYFIITLTYSIIGSILIIACYYGSIVLLNYITLNDISVVFAFFIGWQFVFIFKCATDFSNEDVTWIAGLITAVFLVIYYYITLLI